VVTNFAGPDIVICTLEDSFTPAERKLAEMGEYQRLRDTRLYFQYATDREFRAVVEATSRSRSSIWRPVSTRDPDGTRLGWPDEPSLVRL
jgi:hypothetical protein